MQEDRIIGLCFAGAIASALDEPLFWAFFIVLAPLLGVWLGAWWDRRS